MRIGLSDSILHIIVFRQMMVVVAIVAAVVVVLHIEVVVGAVMAVADVNSKGRINFNFVQKDIDLHFLL